MNSMKIYTIYLDAGHGKHTEGKCSNECLRGRLIYLLRKI